MDIHSRMLSFCKTNNIVCVDLSTSLIKFDDSRAVRASPFDNHPSAEVHRKIAEALCEVFRVDNVEVPNS